MIMLILVIVVFILLDVAAMRWGYDSRDTINSTEWARREEWLFAHHARQE